MSIQVKKRTGVQTSAFLEQLSGDARGRVFELHSHRLTLGRASDCDLQIEAEGVSRVHALLVHSEGAWFIRDNNSKNGIYLNGQPIKESWLESGDVVLLGTFQFKFDAGSAPVAQDFEMGAHLPDVGGFGGPLAMDAAGGALEAPGATAPTGAKSGGKRLGSKMNPRMMVYLGVIGLFGLYWLFSSPAPENSAGSTDPGGVTASGLARDFKTAEAPILPLGSKDPIPAGMEDPMLRRAEQEMQRLDWTNGSLRESEQFFRRGQREYSSKNYHRAIDSFRTALSIYSGHILAESYLRRAIYEAEIEAKKQMGLAIQYYEAMQYSRAIHHFNEVIALLAHRPNEPAIKEAQRYIKQAELRLQAAELFP